jgi:hypothetical protein
MAHTWPSGAARRQRWQPPDKLRRSQTMIGDINDPTTAIRLILREADELMRRRFQEARLNVSPILAGVTPDRAVILHTAVSPDVLRWFSEDLKNITQGIAATANARDARH